MTLIGLVFVVLTVCQSRHVALAIGKCCRDDLVLAAGSNSSVCVERDLVEGFPEVYSLKNSIGGLPACEDPEDVRTTPLLEFDGEYLPTPGCFDVLEGFNESYPILVHCDSRDAGLKATRVLQLRRCCSRGSIFDAVTRRCARTDDPVDLEALPDQLSRILRDVDVLIAESGPPVCEFAIYDYHVNTDELVYYDGSLSVRLPSWREEGRTENFTITERNACVESYAGSPSDLVIRKCMERDFCAERACVRKCCAEDEAFMMDNCRRNAISVTDLQFHEALLESSARSNSSFSDYGVLVGKPCKNGMYPVLPNEEWNVTSRGHVHVPGYQVYQHHEYCMDVFYNSSEFEEVLYPFVCFGDSDAHQEEVSSIRYGVNAALELTSCAFLLMTLLVYVCLPGLQNLHGKTLMCHVASMLMAYGCLAAVALATPETGQSQSAKQLESTIFCKFLGYTMLFSFLSAFSWLNVMCFDIWWTFGALRGSTMTRRRSQRKRFLLFCLYAWGLALVISTVAIVFDHTDYLPLYVKPNIGEERCWFAHEASPENGGAKVYGEIMFFTGPITIQLVSNVVFFVLTSIHCSRVKAEIRRVIVDPSDPRTRRYHADRTKYVMNLKLFIVMGISWVLEVVSFFLNQYARSVQWREEFFYLSDVVNCSQGLLIFVLFVLKGRVYVALRRRLGIDDKKRSGASNTTTLQDPYRVKKSSSSSTLVSTFNTVSMAPS